MKKICKSDVYFDDPEKVGDGQISKIPHDNDLIKLNNSTQNFKSRYYSVNNISLSIIKKVESFTSKNKIDKVVSIDIIKSDNSLSKISSIGENFENLLKEKLKLEANFIETSMSFKTIQTKSAVNNSCNQHFNTSEDFSNQIEELIYYKNHLVPYKKERACEFQIILESDENDTTKCDIDVKFKKLDNSVTKNENKNKYELDVKKKRKSETKIFEINLANNFTISNNASTTAYDIIDTLLNSNNNVNTGTYVNHNCQRINTANENVYSDFGQNCKSQNQNSKHNNDFYFNENHNNPNNKNDPDPVFKSNEEEQIFKDMLSNELVKLLKTNCSFITGIKCDYNFKNINEILKYIITCANGSKFMQKYLNNSSKLVNGIMFESIKDSLIELLKNQYSSFFCQKLFLCLSANYREVFINYIIDNFLDLCLNEISNMAVNFILENELSFEEKKTIIRFIQKHYSKLLWKNKFTRIFECIIGNFPDELIYYIKEYVINNICRLHSSKEGYYLLKTLIKSSKKEKLQIKISEKVIENIKLLIKSLNGCYLIQTIIQNFPLKNYKYEKVYSSFLNDIDQINILENNENRYSENIQTNDNIEIIETVKQEKVEKNIALLLLFKAIRDNNEYWSDKCFKFVVAYALKFGFRSFEIFFLDTFYSSFCEYEFETTKFAKSVNDYNFNSYIDYLETIDSSKKNIKLLNLMMNSNGSYFIKMAINEFSHRGRMLLLNLLLYNLPFLDKSFLKIWNETKLLNLLNNETKNFSISKDLENLTPCTNLNQINNENKIHNNEPHIDFIHSKRFTNNIGSNGDFNLAKIKLLEEIEIKNQEKILISLDLNSKKQKQNQNEINFNEQENNCNNDNDENLNNVVNHKKLKKKKKKCFQKEEMQDEVKLNKKKLKNKKEVFKPLNNDQNYLNTITNQVTNTNSNGNMFNFPQSNQIGFYTNKLDNTSINKLGINYNLNSNQRNFNIDNINQNVNSLNHNNFYLNHNHNKNYMFDNQMKRMNQNQNQNNNQNANFFYSSIPHKGIINDNFNYNNDGNKINSLKYSKDNDYSYQNILNFNSNFNNNNSNSKYNIYRDNNNNIGFKINSLDVNNLNNVNNINNVNRENNFNTLQNLNENTANKSKDNNRNNFKKFNMDSQINMNSHVNMNKGTKVVNNQNINSLDSCNRQFHFNQLYQNQNQNQNHNNEVTQNSNFQMRNDEGNFMDFEKLKNSNNCWNNERNLNLNKLDHNKNDV